jgi:hypothetical protein
LAGIFFSFLSPTQKMDNFFSSFIKKRRNRQRKNESRTLTNDFFLFFLTHLFFGEKKYYILHSSALKEEDHQEMKKGEIFHQWEKIRFECVCVFSLFCLGGKNIFLIFFSSPLYIF